jgi:signal transduction histidine kinase
MISLRELLYNAAKYSDGEHVSLSVTAQPWTSDTKSLPTVRFIVQDIGKGISKEDRDLMFKFFTKVDDLSEGLGLGLPLAKRHAINLGGDLTLDDNYHDGCRFIIELPLN